MQAKGGFKIRLLLFIAAVALVSLLIHTLISDWEQKRPRLPQKQVGVTSKSGMVASAHPLASKIGVEILKKGGNAIDAAVGTAFALGVVEPFASGIGGGGFMLIYVAKNKEVVTIDYREMASLRAGSKTGQTLPGQGGNDQLDGHSSVAIPGTVAGLALALKTFGTMDLKEVLEPAIKVAEDGFEVSKLLNTMMSDNAEKLKKFPEAARIYLKNGSPFKVGDRLQLSDLAKTYRLIAESGPGAFYNGVIAEAIEKEMKSGKGTLGKEDLAAYHPVLRTPVKGNYRGFDIFSMGPPSSGGTHVIELLNILEGYDIRRLGLNNSESISLLADAMQQVFVDRARYMGDPDFVKIPLENLLSKTHAERLRKEISGGKRHENIASNDLSRKKSDQTSHLSIIDGEGNLVALTQTINSFFGSGVVVTGTGILLNNEMNDFAPDRGSPNSVEPGKRPLSSMSPVVALKDGNPYLTIGMPGATRIITVLPQILMNIIDHQMSIQEAINVPRIHCMADREIFLESRISKEVQDELEAKGYKLDVKKDFDLYFGGTQGVMIDPKTGVLHGGADPRRDGSVLGYRTAGAGKGDTGGTASEKESVTSAMMLVIAMIAVAYLAAVIFFQKRRTVRLRSQFGVAEYARAVQASGNRRRAEAELEKRKKRVAALHIQPLAMGDRNRFIELWRAVQARFVDAPGDAITEADQLLCDVMSARGYPVTDFEERAANISVDHPLVVENYRAAHEIAVRHSEGQANTEDLRQAMIYYRTLLEELVGGPVISRGKSDL